MGLGLLLFYPEKAVWKDGAGHAAKLPARGSTDMGFHSASPLTIMLPIHKHLGPLSHNKPYPSGRSLRPFSSQPG